MIFYVGDYVWVLWGKSKSPWPGYISDDTDYPHKHARPKHSSLVYYFGSDNFNYENDAKLLRIICDNPKITKIMSCAQNIGLRHGMLALVAELRSKKKGAILDFLRRKCSADTDAQIRRALACEPVSHAKESKIPVAIKHSVSGQKHHISTGNKPDDHRLPEVNQPQTSLPDIDNESPDLSETRSRTEILPRTDVIPSHPSTTTANALKMTLTRHPPYLQMIKDAIVALKDKKGSSRHSILVYIQSTFQLTASPNIVNYNLKKALRYGLNQGIISHANGTTLKGLFRLASNRKRRPRSTHAPDPKASLLILPDDILEELFDLVRNSYDTADRACRKLLPLSRLCHRFHRIIPRIALREVRYSSSTWAMGSPEAMDGFRQCLTRPTTTGNGQLVPRISYADKLFMTDFVWGGFIGFNQATLILQDASRLTELALSFPSLPDGSTVSDWDCCPNLISLSLAVRGNVPDDFFLALGEPEICPKLTNLSFETVGNACSVQFLTNLGDIASRLTSLRLVDDWLKGTCFADNLAPSLSQLQTLDLTLDSSGAQYWLGKTIATYCTSLQELKVGPIAEIASLFIGLCRGAAGMHNTLSKLEIGAVAGFRMNDPSLSIPVNTIHLILKVFQSLSSFHLKISLLQPTDADQWTPLVEHLHRLHPDIFTYEWDNFEHT